MFWVMVADEITIPLGFAFYKSDPEWIKYNNKDMKLRKQKI